MELIPSIDLLDGKVVPLKVVAPHVGDYVCRVAMKALSPDASVRQQTAIDLHTELTAARSSEAAGRQWRTVATCVGHERCWESSSLGSKKSLRVCLIPLARNQYEIRVMHAASRRQFKSPIATTSNDRAKDLRKTFKEI